MTVNACGSCTMCCKLPAVPELDKPSGIWCQHCNKTSGCKIYDARPKGCADYKCIWLSSQFLPSGEIDKRGMPPELRPDRCKVILSFARDEKLGHYLCVAVDPSYPNAWKTPLVRHEIIQLHKFKPTLPVYLFIGSVGYRLNISENQINKLN